MPTINITLPKWLDPYFPETPVSLGPVLLMRQSVAQREREHQGTMALAMGALRQRNPIPSPAPQASGHEAPRGADRAGREAGGRDDVSSSLPTEPVSSQTAARALFGEGR